MTLFRSVIKAISGRKAAVLAAIFLAQNTAQAQGLNFWNRCGDTLDINLYPSDSFKVKQLNYAFGPDQVRLYILRYESEYPEDQVWVEHRRAGKLLNSRYLGGISSGENGVALPAIQSIPGVFALYTAGEFSGTYHLIAETGDWFELPGNSLTYNHSRTALYTFVPHECGGCPIGSFSLQTKTLTTKISTGGTDAWQEEIDRNDIGLLFKDATWVKWK